MSAAGETCSGGSCMTPEEVAAMVAQQTRDDEARTFLLPVSNKDLRVLTEALRLLAKHKSAKVRAARKPAKDGIGGWGSHLEHMVREGAFALDLETRLLDAALVKHRHPRPRDAHEVLLDAPLLRIYDAQVHWALSPHLAHYLDGKRTHGATWSVEVKKWNSNRFERVYSGDMEIEPAAPV